VAGRSGVVWIAEEVDRERHMLWTGRFSAHWESDDGQAFSEGREEVSAAEAIEWGMQRADVVWIRVGDGEPEPASLPAPSVGPRWQAGYEHLGLVTEEPIEWEARVPVPSEDDRTTVVVRARSHEEALPLALEEWERIRPPWRPSWRQRLRMWRGRGIYVQDSGFDPYDDLRPAGGSGRPATGRASR